MKVTIIFEEQEVAVGYPPHRTSIETQTDDTYPEAAERLQYHIRWALNAHFGYDKPECWEDA